MNTGESTTEDSLSLGLDFLASTRHASDSLADIFFTDTEISYRDDNRVMWIFIEDGDEGDDIFQNEIRRQRKTKKLKQLFHRTITTNGTINMNPISQIGQ